jgi:acetyltransferase-like isoleucine patch superfamily enzyme
VSPAIDQPDTPRHQRLTRFPTPGTQNSLWMWTSFRNPLSVMFNFAIIYLARYSPSLRVKNWLFRLIGVTIGDGVSWGLESTPDVFWPELISIGSNTIIGYDATILCHEFLQDECRIGEVTIGERTMIGAGSVILPGVCIGDDVQVGANSVVTKDLPDGSFAAGVPAKILSNRG